MRRPSESVAVRNEAVVVRLRELKGGHPFWGYVAAGHICGMLISPFGSVWTGGEQEAGLSVA